MTFINKTNDCLSTTCKSVFENETENDFSNISIYWRNLNYEIRSTTPLFNVVNRVFKRRSPPPLSPSAQCSSPSDVPTNYISKRMILNQLNGSFASGTLNALMGPSGAGKTTLLNILSYAITDGVTGQYYCSKFGQTPDIGFRSSNGKGQNATNACYIEQHVDDSIAGRLTVGEILRYAYRFKNYRRRREGEKGKVVRDQIYMDRHIAKTLTDLMLPPEIIDRRFEQCSGGERKRIAIGQELMSIDRPPDFLFLDEPTTGLDSSAAYEVILALRRLTTITANEYRRNENNFDVDANGNVNVNSNLDVADHKHYSNSSVTIIASIHSPSVEILAMFDQLYVLALNGVAIYSGPPNAIAQTISDLIGNNIENSQQTECSGKDCNDSSDHFQPPIEILIKIANGTESDEENIRKLAQFTANRETMKIGNVIHCQQNLKNLSLPVRDNVDDKSSVDTNIITINEGNNQRIGKSEKSKITRKEFLVGDLALQIERLFRINFVANFHIFLIYLLYQVVSLAYFSSIFSSGAKMVRPNGCLRSFLSINQTNDIKSDVDQNSSQEYSFISSCHLDAIATDSLITENLNYLCSMNILIGFPSVITGTVTFASIAKMFRNEYRNRWYSFSSVFWPNIMVSMLEWTIYSLVITICAYFFTEQYAADQSATEDTIVINWHRLSLFGATIWLRMMYMQCLGQLIGCLFMNSSTAATMISCASYVTYSTFGDYLILVDELESAPIRAMANIMAAKYETRLLLFTIYGIDRCDSYDQSAILKQNYIDPSHLTFYIARILQNFIVLRLATLAIIYVKFNRFPNIAKQWLKLVDYRPRWWWWQKSTNVKNEKADNETRSQVASISIDVVKRKTKNHLPKLESSIENSVKNLHGKPIIAFRNLFLYKPSLIFDQRYRAQSGITYKKQDKNKNKKITKNKNNNNIGDCDTILQNLSGTFCFGTLNALMGPSGAGKTSLLNVLNGQFGATGRVYGSFYLSKYAHLVTRFIAQNIDHHLISGLTVRQSLIYASRFKNKKNNSAEVGNEDAHMSFDHEEIADRVADQFNLQHIAHTPVDACSGGERKRLALALELTTITSHNTSNLTIPNLIFIDEPTSGLDSRSAEMVISFLHKLTRSLSHSMTIIASIHQPTTDILNRIDHIYMLAYGGVCIFDGPPASMIDAIEMVSRQNETNAQPSSLLAASQQLTRYACRGGCHKDTILQLANVDKFESNNMIEIETHCRPRNSSIGRNRSPRFTIVDISTLISRYVTCFIGAKWFREWAPLAIAITIYGFNVLTLFPARNRMAASAGCIEPAVDDLDITHCDDAHNTLRREELKLLKDAVNYIYFSFIIIMPFVTFYTALTFIRDLRHFAVEHRNGWYSTGSFYVAKIVTDIVPLLPVFVIFVYIVDNHDEATRPGYYAHSLLVTVLLVIAAQSSTDTIVFIANQNFKITFILLILIFQTIILLSNIFMPINRLHYLYQMLSMLNPARYAVEAFILLQYGFGRCDYSIGQVQPLLYIFDLHDADYAYDIAMIVANIIFHRLIAFVLLLRFAKSCST